MIPYPPRMHFAETEAAVVVTLGFYKALDQARDAVAILRDRLGASPELGWFRAAVETAPADADGTVTYFVYVPKLVSGSGALRADDRRAARVTASGAPLHHPYPTPPVEGVSR